MTNATLSTSNRASVLYVRPERHIAVMWMVAWPLAAIVFVLIPDGFDRGTLAMVGLSLLPCLMGVHQMWFSYIRLDDTTLERVRFFGLQHERVHVSDISSVAFTPEPTLVGVDKLRMVIEWPTGRLPLPLDQFLGTRHFPSVRNAELVPLVLELESRGVPVDPALKVELEVGRV